MKYADLALIKKVKNYGFNPQSLLKQDDYVTLNFKSHILILEKI